MFFLLEKSFLSYDSQIQIMEVMVGVGQKSYC
jgi:hypothetical protein